MERAQVTQTLLECLPREFPFYHLGQVEMRPRELSSELNLAPAASSDQLAVAFSFDGDVKAVLAILFDGSLDVSTYSELGNIIASQAATRLANAQGLDVVISPPRVLTRKQLESLSSSAPLEGAIARDYQHIHQGRAIAVQAWILPKNVMEDAGHA